MPTDVHVLEFGRKELLKETYVYQTENGTYFYHQSKRSTQRLYVKLNGNSFDVQLPKCGISNIGVHGNALYFEANRKVYKASFTSSDNLAVAHSRNLLENEEMHAGGMCSRMRGQGKYVYRMGDDPDMDGILIDVSDEDLRGLELRGIHRGRAIYIGSHYRLSSSNLSENVVVVQVQRSGNAVTYFQENSPFFYIANGPSMYTLDINRLEFLPSMRFKQVSIHSIAGIRNGEITVCGYVNSEFYLMSAQLPEKFLNETNPFLGQRVITKRDNRRSERTSSSSEVGSPTFSLMHAQFEEMNNDAKKKDKMRMKKPENELNSNKAQHEFDNCAIIPGTISKIPFELREENNHKTEDISKMETMTVKNSNSIPIPRFLDNLPNFGRANSISENEHAVDEVAMHREMKRRNEMEDRAFARMLEREYELSLELKRKDEMIDLAAKQARMNYNENVLYDMQSELYDKTREDEEMKLRLDILEKAILEDTFVPEAPVWHIANDRLRTMGVPEIVVGEVVFEPVAVLLAILSLCCYGLFGITIVLITALVQSRRHSESTTGPARHSLDLVHPGSLATPASEVSATPVRTVPWYMPRSVTASAHFT